MAEAIGQVVMIDGSRVSIRVGADAEDLRATRVEGACAVGQPGTYVLVDGGAEQFLVMVVAQRRGPGAPGAQAAAETTYLDGILIGAMTGADFEVGVSRLPVVGDTVTPAGENELVAVMAAGAGECGISIGTYGQWEIPVALDVNRLFGMHTAILGTTGSGKSYTVARVVQEVEDRFPSANVVIFDLHGEYTRCFAHARVVQADQMKLPAWLHTFDHLFELFADYSDEEGAHNQRFALRSGVYALKQKYCREVLGDEALSEDIDLDSPIPFEFNRVHTYLHNLNNETRGIRSGAATISDRQPEDWFGRRMVFDNPVEGQIRPGHLRGRLDRLLMRIESKINDPRYAFMFQDEPPTPDSLERKVREISGFLGAESKRVTVFDLSRLPNETVGTVVATISRVLFQLHFWSHGTVHTPTLVVYEEAHNYISRGAVSAHEEARECVERIAKEGRKFGIGTLIVSQRPGELSETLLSQCNSFLCMRMGNPRDREHVSALLPGGMASLVDILPALPRGHVLALGRATALPVRMVVAPMADEARAPDSKDVDFGARWRSPMADRPAPNIANVCRNWLESRKSESQPQATPEPSPAPTPAPAPSPPASPPAELEVMTGL